MRHILLATLNLRPGRNGHDGWTDRSSRVSSTATFMDRSLNIKFYGDLRPTINKIKIQVQLLIIFTISPSATVVLTVMATLTDYKKLNNCNKPPKSDLKLLLHSLEEECLSN